MVLNQNSQGGSRGGSTYEIPKCTTCGKKHSGKCLAGMDGCFGCGNMGHMMRNCPKLKAKGKEVNKSPYGGSDPNA